MGKDVPTVGEGAAVGALLADELRLADRHLVIHEDAVLDDGKFRADGAHAVVVVADGGEPALLAAVGDDVHQLAAVLELAELVRRAESRAGEIRLPAERAIEFRGMADRFVDGQPEIGRVEDEIVVVGRDRLRLQFFAGLLRRLGRFAGEIVAEDVVVAAAARGGETGARGEFAGGLVDHGDFRLGHGADARLRRSGCRRSRRKTFPRARRRR